MRLYWVSAAIQTVSQVKDNIVPNKESPSYWQHLIYNVSRVAVVQYGLGLGLGLGGTMDREEPV